MTDTARIRLICILLIALVGIVLCVVFAAIASAATPVQLYLPTVQRDMPAMSAEYTPLQPAPTLQPGQ